MISENKLINNKVEKLLKYTRIIIILYIHKCLNTEITRK